MIIVNKAKQTSDVKARTDLRTCSLCQLPKENDKRTPPRPSLAPSLLLRRCKARQENNGRSAHRGKKTTSPNSSQQRKVKHSAGAHTRAHTHARTASTRTRKSTDNRTKWCTKTAGLHAKVATFLRCLLSRTQVEKSVPSNPGKGPNDTAPWSLKKQLRCGVETLPLHYT